ncbi:MAG: hypothetical protein DDT21_02635 [Syntrophomonadaceae bacterium]|nr:hypothetical protein [Bacillota bacterium]
MKIDQYQVNFTLIEPLLGTVPKDTEIYKTYIAGKKDSRGNPLVPMDSMSDEEVGTVPAGGIENRGWTGFHTDENGCFLYNYAILGFLKEAGNTLKEQLGIKALKSKIDQFVFVEPRRIYLKAAPDGVLERSLRAMTMQGPRVTLVRSDYISAGTEFEANLLVLKNKEIDSEIIRAILEYGCLRGLGQFRNGSYGRFEFDMKAWA